MTNNVLAKFCAVRGKRPILQRYFYVLVRLYYNFVRYSIYLSLRLSVCHTRVLY